mgnify:FL=1
MLRYRFNEGMRKIVCKIFQARTPKNPRLLLPISAVLLLLEAARVEDDQTDDLFTATTHDNIIFRHLTVSCLLGAGKRNIEDIGFFVIVKP